MTLNRWEEIKQRKIKIMTLALSGLFGEFLFAKYVMAAELPSGIQQERNLQKNREEKTTTEQQLNTPPFHVEVPTSPVESVLPAASSSSFMIDRIELDDGGKPIELGTQALFATYEHRRLDNQAVFALLRELTNRLFQRGYVTTTIIPVARNLRDGVLKLQIEWGRVSGWLINGHVPASGKERRMISAAMPGIVGQPLNIYDIDQALENLNNKAKLVQISIIPAPETGFSLLNLTIQPNESQTVMLGVNNSGPGRTAEGRYQAMLHASVSDLFGWNETVGIGLNKRFYPGVSGNSQLGYSFFYQQPMGYVMFNGSYNHLGYDKQLNGIFGNYDSNGISDEVVLKLSAVMSRHQTGKFSIHGGLNYKNAKNYVAGLFTPVNSHPYTNIMVGASWLRNMLYGGILYSDITWYHGISWLGGASGATDSTRDGKNANFINGNLSWSRDFTLFRSKFNYLLRMGAQYAPSNLVGVYKMALGDEYTVRGFKGDPLTGDQAVYVSHTCNLPHLQLGSGVRVSPFVGIDYGWARHVQTNDRGVLSGVALGLRAQWRLADLSLTLAHPLRSLPGDSATNTLYLGLNIGI